MKSKITSILLIAILINSMVIPVFGAPDKYTHSSLDIIVSKDGVGYTETVDALIEENDIYIKAEQFAKLTKYTYAVTEENKGVFRLGMKFVVVDYKKQKLTVNTTKQPFSGAILSNGEYYLPFSEIIPWLNVSVDIEKGLLRLESDVLSYWEVINDFEPADYYFFYAEEMGDDLTSVIGLSAIHVFDSLLNLGDVWKKIVPVTGAEGDTCLYDYEVYVDAFREFAFPADATSEALGIPKKIAKGFSNYSKLTTNLVKGVESEECYNEIAYAIGVMSSKKDIDTTNGNELYREMYIEEGSKIIGEYNGALSEKETWPETYKQINNAFKLVNTGFSCLNIMMTDTESYGKALDYIYLRENSQATDGEKLAASKVSAMMESNLVAVLESAKPLAGDFTADACEELIKETVNVWADAVDKKISVSSIGTYLTIIDSALSLFWPVNEAFGEVAKLPVYTAIQQNAYDAFYDARVMNTEVSEESLEMSRMTAIIYLKAALKCFKAKDSMMSVFGATGLVDHYFNSVNEMISNFEVCLLAQEHDTIGDKTEFTSEIRKYLEDLDLLLSENTITTTANTENADTTTNTTAVETTVETTAETTAETTTVAPTPDISKDLIGDWYYYTELSGQTVVWEIRISETREIVIAVGYMFSEYSYWESGNWSLTNNSGEHILTVSLPSGDTCDCIVTLEGNKIKLDKKSGSDDIAIKYGQWYERDKAPALFN